MSPEPTGGTFSPITAIPLRCKSCSAPITANPSDEIVRCEYCGSSQRMVDARAFFDQMMLQVNSWLRQAVPGGIQAGGAGSVDPVARQMVLASNIMPRLTSEYGEYRFSCFNILSHPMMVLPRMTERGIASLVDSQRVFLFQAKVQSVLPFAVDDEAKGTLSQINGISVIYGYMLNNVALMADTKLERYHFMTQNFDAAASSIKEVAGFAALKERFEALEKLSRGLDLLTDLHPSDAMPYLRDARARLGVSKDIASKDFDMAIMLQAIDKEMSLANSSIHLAETISLGTSSDTAEGMVPILSLLDLMCSLQDVPNPQWRARFKEQTHHERILKSVNEAMKAKMGDGGLKVLPSSGSLLLPFWVVDLPYTFQTGALWKTQGVEVTESFLIAATFPAEPAALSGTDPSLVLTDIFRGRSSGGFLDDTIRSLSGKETSISGGGAIRDALRNCGLCRPSGVRIVPPLSTEQDAIILAQEYVARACQTDRTIQKKLRLSSPRVVELVYAAASPERDRTNILPMLGNLSPYSVGNLDLLLGTAL